MLQYFHQGFQPRPGQCIVLGQRRAILAPGLEHEAVGDVRVVRNDNDVASPARIDTGLIQLPVEVDRQLATVDEANGKPGSR